MNNHRENVASERYKHGREQNKVFDMADVFATLKTWHFISLEGRGQARRAGHLGRF